MVGVAVLSGSDNGKVVSSVRDRRGNGHTGFQTGWNMWKWKVEVESIVCENPRAHGTERTECRRRRRRRREDGLLLPVDPPVLVLGRR